MRTAKMVFLVCVLMLLFGACTNTADKSENLPVSEQSPMAETTSAPQTTSDYSARTEPSSQPKVTEATTASLYSLPEKSGDMIFTDDPSNQFIQAVAEKYGLDTSRLAAIYTEPPADTNMVWEFNGMADENGKLIRNADTLKYVYTVTADCSGITRAGGLRDNDGISAAAGYFLMQSTKQLILPKFQEQLDA